MYDPQKKFRDECFALASSALSELGFSPTVQDEKHMLAAKDGKIAAKLSLEAPPEGMGDFALAAFPLAKPMRKSPADVAKELAARMKKSALVEFKNTGPYVNFYINQDKLKEDTITCVLVGGEKYGNAPKRNKTIVLEHTSANPNGPFHVGRARNPIIGDTLARVMRAGGHDVTAQYYVNDMGKQAVILTWGSKNLKPEDIKKFEGHLAAKKDKEQDKVLKSSDKGPDDSAKDAENSDKGADKKPYKSDKPDHKMVRYYQTANMLLDDEKEKKTAEGEKSATRQIDEMLRKYESGDASTKKNVHETCKAVLSGMTESLSRINIGVDEFVWESKFVFDKSVNNIVDRLKESKEAKLEDGAYCLDFGEGKGQFFFTRKDGTSLYTTRDLAYHIEKLKRFDAAVNILGEDHKAQASYVSAALKILAQNEKFAKENGDIAEKLAKLDEKLKSVFYSFVSLAEGKMSTRMGTSVYLDDLIDEAIALAKEEVKKRRPELSEADADKIANIVAVGAIRYNIIRIQAEKPITFKWDEALNFEGNSAPFIQYAHARTCSILKKAVYEAAEEAAQEASSGACMCQSSKIRCGDKGAACRPYDFNPADVKHLAGKSELDLIKCLAKFPTVIKDCSENMNPHSIAEYAHETASLFNQFYRDASVLGGGEARNVRLATVDATRIVLKNALGLLGIEAPEEM